MEGKPLLTEESAAFTADRQIPPVDPPGAPGHPQVSFNYLKWGPSRFYEPSFDILKKSPPVLRKGKEKVIPGLAATILNLYSWKRGFHFSETSGKQSRCVAEKVLEGGPWYVNSHIMGMDKWSPLFTPSSLKGLSSPIWIRLPHLPLICWDKDNVARIASMIGQPLWIDGNMFQWSKREFARVCIRMALDQQFPIGVWVESSYGRFFQKFEYEKVTTICFKCGEVGHLIDKCIEGNPTNLEGQTSKMGPHCENQLPTEGLATDKDYGPWILVKNTMRRRRTSSNIEKSVNRGKQGCALQSIDAKFSKDMEESRLEDNSKGPSWTETFTVKDIPDLEMPVSNSYSIGPNSARKENKGFDTENGTLEEGKIPDQWMERFVVVEQLELTDSSKAKRKLMKELISLGKDNILSQKRKSENSKKIKSGI
ncbi:uncharacterized protein LOC110098681 [Dendrobium catenatum]|uniref:uncharacterized protein LOC110098681 n=1 Tax=Dendrobium catenatum TaxID=906689 RepID=UPI0009F49B10|nr:uncharacterized protein LOC110098681 [Dendrobium catenatum]